MNLTTNQIVGITLGLIVALFGGIMIIAVLGFGNDSAAKNDINSFYDAESLYYSSNQAYANDTALQASMAKITLSPGVSAKVNSAAAGFCIAAKHTQGTKTFYRVSGQQTILETAPAATALPTGVTCPTP